MFRLTGEIKNFNPRRGVEPLKEKGVNKNRGVGIEESGLESSYTL